MVARPLAVLAAVLLTTGAATAQIQFGYRALALLPGDQLATPIAMNAHGDIVGTSFDAAYVACATLWIDGVPQSLGTLPGTTSSYALALNQLREVVGISTTSGSPDRSAWIWDAVNGMRELPPPIGHSNAMARDLNESGTIIGSSVDASGFTQIVRWDHLGAATLLGVPAGYDDAAPAGINRFGEICGTATASGGRVADALRYDDVNGFRMLPPPGTGRTSSNDIRDDGIVCGAATDDGELITWNGLVPTSLGFGKNGGFLWGVDRNEQGWIIGFGNADEGLEFYDGHRFDYVVDLLPSSVGAYSMDSTWVADNGCLLGTPVDDNYELLAGFVLEPPSRLEIDGGQIGGTIAFRHVAPTFPGKLAATLVSLTGMVGSFHVGKGTHVRLDFDIATATLLGFPGIGILALDGSGRATTAAIDIDNDPALSGLPGWACSVVFQGGKTPPVGSTTMPFILE